MRQVLSWRRALILAGTALLVGCDRLPEAGDRMVGPGFLLTATPGTGAWTTKPYMSAPRAAHAVAALGDTLYAAGGGNYISGALATVEAYNPRDNAWTPRASMLTTRVGFGLVAIRGRLYAVGGCCDTSGQQVTNTVEEYDPATDTWTPKSPMRTARFFFGDAVIRDTLYVEGGYLNGVGFLSSVEAYDPVTDTWTTRTSMPTARYALGAAAVNGSLYAVGGANGSADLNTVEAYDPSSDSWTTKAAMPTARLGLGVSVVNGILYAVGGGSGATDINYAQDLGTVEAYNPVSNTWTTQASMPTTRKMVGVAPIDGLLYAVGGKPLGNYNELATVEAYTPPYAFTGFFQPVDNPAVVNALKAGSAVPVKFSLHGYQGLDILAAGYPSSQGYTCDGSSEDAIEQTVTAGSSSLSYDATTDQYTYVWKTDRAWAGTCRQFQLGLKDGGIQVALFHFTK